MSNAGTQGAILEFLESEEKFRQLCAFFAQKSVAEIIEPGCGDTLRPYVTAGFKLLVERCHGTVTALTESPIERVFLRSVMLSFLKNGSMLVFMPSFRNTPTDVRDYREQLLKLEEFTSWYEQKHGSSVISKEYLDGQVNSGRMSPLERPWIEELLLLYHYLPFREAWHVSLQPRFPNLLRARGSRPDMLFWQPLRDDRLLVVECDGFSSHSTKESFERDRQKDRALKALGFDVFRFGGREINSEPVMRAHELFSFLDDWGEAKHS